jgi:apolipoprotein N-acyltransferase
VRLLGLSILSGLALVLAYPPYGWEWVLVPAIAAYLYAVARAPSPRRAGLIGFAFGMAFFMALFPWIGELGDVPLIGLLPLALVEAVFPTVYAWAVRRWAPSDPIQWWVVATGGWGLMEMLRVRFPLGGFGWGLAGYPAGELSALRDASRWIGVSGWSVVLVSLAAGLAVIAWHRLELDREAMRIVVGLPLAVIVLLAIAGGVAGDPTTGRAVDVAIVQGSTPCPDRCPGDRVLIYERHIDLTRSIDSGAVEFVVWPEGSSGFSVDPVLDPAIGTEIGTEAARIGAAMLVGGDRPLSDTEWVNANVVFDQTGQIVGEYRKRHPVPFGEYIPARPVFDWIPDLRRVPRDMVRGDGPVLFDLGFGPFGSVISFESSFSRYIRQTVNEGAEFVVIATSQASYPRSNASDQLIGMTRMHAAENGIDLVHSAVTGRSTFITDGGVVAEPTGLLESTVLYGTVELREGGPTLYGRLGDWVQYLAVVVAVGVVVAERVKPATSGRFGKP